MRLKENMLIVFTKVKTACCIIQCKNQSVNKNVNYPRRSQSGGNVFTFVCLCVCFLSARYLKNRCSYRIIKLDVKYTPICINYASASNALWITQFYLQITPKLLPSRRASPPFGWYSFYRPTKGRRLRRPGWSVTYRNKVPPPGVEPGHGHPSQY